MYDKPHQAGLGASRAPGAKRTEQAAAPHKVAVPQVPAPQLAQPIMRKDGAVGRASGVTGSLKRYKP